MNTGWKLLVGMLIATSLACPIAPAAVAPSASADTGENVTVDLHRMIPLAQEHFLFGMRDDLEAGGRARTVARGTGDDAVHLR